jgi:hypothetical protein
MTNNTTPPKRLFSEALKSLVLSFQRPLKRLLRFTFLRVHHDCASLGCGFLYLSLSPNIFALFSPAKASTRSHPAELAASSATPTLAFPAFSFKNEALNAVLH